MYDSSIWCRATQTNPVAPEFAERIRLLFLRPWNTSRFLLRRAIHPLRAALHAFSLTSPKMHVCRVQGLSSAGRQHDDHP